MTDPVQPRTGPCVGLKVLDLSTMVSGPMCGQMFGDLGADVVKLESVEGDALRQAAPQHKGFSAYFQHFNRNKRSIAVNLKSEEGRAIAKRLAGECDVLIENFRPDVAARLGIDYETLRATNPGLVYISIKGFGEDGPDRDLPAYDPVIQALAGFMAVQGTGGTPVPIANAVADKIAAMSGAMSGLAALVSRQLNGGQGQKVIVKMMDAWANFISHEEVRNHTFIESEAPPAPKSGTHRVFKARDGHVMALTFQDSQFKGITKVLNRPDLLEDPRFAKLRERVLNTEALSEELAKSMENMTVAELTAGAREHDVPLAKVHTLEEFFDYPQARHNKTFPTWSDPELGDMRGLSFFASFTATPLHLAARAPKLGEQAEDILSEAGFGPDEIARMRQSGAIR